MSTGRVIQEIHTNEVTILDDAFAQAAVGLQDAPRTDNDLNKAWILLGVKIYNGLLGAMLLLVLWLASIG